MLNNTLSRRKILQIFIYLNLCNISMLFAQIRVSSVYQYEVKVGGRTAYLWVPPHSRYIRGVVIAAENALERNWMESVTVRETATRENLGLIWLADGKPTVIDWKISAPAASALDTMFIDLAKISGFPEIAGSPVIFTGHSWNGRMAWNYPAQRPERVIGVIPIRTYPMPDALSFSGIPMLYIVGQTTELPQYTDGSLGDRDFFWPVVRQTAAALRAKNTKNLIGVAVSPGGCHMDWTENESRLLSLFITKACRYRLPEDYPTDGRVRLKPIDNEDGWLTDTACLDSDRFPSAAAVKFKGNPKHSFWYFDGEMAKAVSHFNGSRQPSRMQMTTFMDERIELPVQRNGYVLVPFHPESDNLSFSVSGGSLKRVPDGLVGAGKKLGHGKGTVRVYPVLGPVIQTTTNHFEISFDRQANRKIMLIAEKLGDGKFRRAVQPGILDMDPVLTKGEVQEINFPDIKDQHLSAREIKLKATASSGLPVQYYVRSGPAIIQKDRLIFSSIPDRAAFPISIAVVACQAGRRNPSSIQTAPQVTRIFRITK